MLMNTFTKMKSVLAALLAAMTLPAQADVTLYGNVIYADGNATRYGIYSFDASSPESIEPCATDTNFDENCFGVYISGIYHGFRNEYAGSGNYNCTTYLYYSTDSWDQEDEDEWEDTGYVTRDVTYDPTSGKVYSLSADGEGGMMLATIDFRGNVERIGTVNPNYVALACDTWGQLYAIRANGTLCKLDKATAMETVVGDTGVRPANYMQSATIDFQSGTMYWATTSTSEQGLLYTVDTATAEATLVGAFPHNEEFVGIFTMSTPKAWEGTDIPGAVENISLTENDGIVTITWSAPTKGIHNGDVAADELTYDVVRMPGNVTVTKGTAELTASDAITGDELNAYYYIITPYWQGQAGTPAQSGNVKIGQYAALPYVQTFDDRGTWELMTVIDANYDEATWEFSGSGDALATFGSYTSNDWLVTPPFNLKNDRAYRYSFKVTAPWAGNYWQNIGAYVGTDCTTSALQKQEVMALVNIKDSEPRVFEGYFTVADNGKHYFAVRTCSEELYDLHLDDLVVEEGPMFTAPAAPSALTVTPGDRGALNATIAFTLPSELYGGGSLAAITKVEVLRDDRVIETLTGVIPGYAQTVADSNVPDAGIHKYSIVAYNENGAGMPVTIKAYIGVDTPSKPLNVKLTETNGAVKLTWDAPLTGVNGGYIDPAALTYNVIIDSEYNLAEGLTARTFTTPINEPEHQQFLTLDVEAASTTGTGPAATSNQLPIGPAYTLPFLESFDGDYPATAWQFPKYEGNYASWTVDRGDQALSFNHGYNNDQLPVYSGKIDISSAKNPVLEYDYIYRAESGPSSLKTYIIGAGTDTVHVKTLDYVRFMNSKPYERVAVKLDDFKKYDYIQIMFECRTPDDVTIVAHIDNVGVRQFNAIDLKAGLSVAEKATAGEELTVTATVENIGENTVSAAKVVFRDGDREIAVKEIEGEIAYAEKKTVEYTFAVSTLSDALNISAEAVANGDEDLSNNTSETAHVAVSLPDYPTVEDINGDITGNEVRLSWNEPAYADYIAYTTDDAESYEPFVPNTFGEWTVIDGDGKNISEDFYVGWWTIDLPHAGEPMGWMVINPVTAEIDQEDWYGDPSGWHTHSGNQFFGSLGNGSDANDDWMISPELSGDEQSVSFFVHNNKSGQTETFEFLYSTTGKEIDDFISVETKRPGADWEQVSYDLPEGARYFAIRNVTSQSSKTLFIDDITFRAASSKGALRLVGYNIYRDGERINAEPVANTDYTDNVAGLDNNGQARTYAVTAVYEAGESVPEEVAVDMPLLIIDAAVDNSDAPAYNVLGQPVGRDYKGIVIQNGRKVYRR